MTNDQWLKKATNTLKAVNIGSARLDALILLEDEIGRDRAWILAHPETVLQGLTLQRLNKKLARRASHEPLAYIRGFTEFYGRKFRVNKRVLEPRPESEAMIDLLRKLAESGELRAKSYIADVGTGSGALGITAALELHNHSVDLYDVDASCLAVARHNCALHELHLHCYKRDLLNRPARPYDVLLANLPYVPDHWKINEAAAMEPRIAIFGGPDGLDVYRRLFEQLKQLPWQPKYIFTESLPPQHQKLAAVAKKAGYKLQKSQDFIQLYKSH
ncbi:MAG: HemK/PrmC family methyltransferase [bacterium]|nr:HemK/PrmC family methyltransferase [bacterium]